MDESYVVCSTCEGVGYPTCRNCGGKKLLPVVHSINITPNELHMEPCPDCDGYGAFVCPTCKGSGTMKKEKD